MDADVLISRETSADLWPDQYPTHLHSPAFCEALGRTIATFGFLENVLARAIFALTATKEYSEDELAAAFAKWTGRLEKTLSDTLYPLTDTYAKAVRDHQAADKTTIDKLASDIRQAAEIRNVLCHGFWAAPDQHGSSIPFYVRGKDKLKFETPIDSAFLKQTHQATLEIAAEVINSVTRLGYRFPGTSGPGMPIG